MMNEQICIEQSRRASRSVVRISHAIIRVNKILANPRSEDWLTSLERCERGAEIVRSLKSDLMREARHEQEWLDELRQERRERMQVECDFRRERRK